MGAESPLPLLKEWQDKLKYFLAHRPHAFQLDGEKLSVRLVEASVPHVEANCSRCSLYILYIYIIYSCKSKSS